MLPNWKTPTEMRLRKRNMTAARARRAMMASFSLPLTLSASLATPIAAKVLATVV